MNYAWKKDFHCKFGSCFIRLEESKQIPAMLESIQGSDLIEVDSTGTKLRRNPEMPPPESKAEDKTVYLKGFNKTETTLDELLGKHIKQDLL